MPLGNFPTQARLIEHIRAIIAKYPDGLNVDEEDDLFLRALLQRHRDAIEKIGKGVHYFTIETEPKYKTRGFWLHRIDGTKTDFSYRMCIRSSSHREDVLAALREAVSEQMIKFREETFNGNEHVFCPLTKQQITRQQAHVDHIYPQTFSQLVKDWSAQEEINLDTVPLERSTDGKIGRKINDAYVVESFQWYHQEHAHLQVIEKSTNIKMSNKPRQETQP